MMQQYTLKKGECVFLKGIARLTVESGRVVVLGKLLGKDNGGVALYGDLEWGGALKISPSLKTDVAVIQLDQIQHYLFESCQEQKWPCITIPSDWQQVKTTILRETPENPSQLYSILNCGSKGAGKSTFGRYLVNSLLNLYSHVYYLDADCGQTEFGVPGFVSLVKVEKPILEPPFMHHTQPIKSFFIGNVQADHNSQLYVQKVCELIEYFRQHIHINVLQKTGQQFFVPLVVNANGWISGAGLEMLVSIAEFLKPFSTVYVKSLSKEILTEPLEGKWETYRLHEISAVGHQIKQKTQETSRNRRRQHWYIWAQSVVQNHTGNIKYNFSLEEMVNELVGVKPFVAKIRDFEVVGTDGTAIDVVNNMHVLNGQFVGLSCGKLEKFACVGIGLIRSVDILNQDIYLLTNLNVDLLQEISCIILGNLEVPDQFLQNSLYCSSKKPMFQILKAGTGASKFVGKVRGFGF